VVAGAHRKIELKSSRGREQGVPTLRGSLWTAFRQARRGRSVPVLRPIKCEKGLGKITKQQQPCSVRSSLADGGFAAADWNLPANAVAAPPVDRAVLGLVAETRALFRNSRCERSADSDSKRASKLFLTSAQSNLVLPYRTLPRSEDRPVKHPPLRGKLSPVSLPRTWRLGSSGAVTDAFRVAAIQQKPQIDG
jgi:hypothetical protein